MKVDGQKNKDKVSIEVPPDTEKMYHIIPTKYPISSAITVSKQS